MMVRCKGNNSRIHNFKIYIYIFGMRLLNCRQFKSLSLHIHFICFRYFFTEKQTGVSQALSRKKPPPKHNWLFHKFGNVKPYCFAFKPEVPIRKFLCVSNAGDVMPPCILPESLRLETEVCIKWLKVVVLAWIERVPAGLHAMPHMQENPGLSVIKILRIHHP